MYLNLCHTRQLFHCIAKELFNFPERCENPENHDIFREELSVMASLQRPRRCYGARMAFHCVPTEFLVAILWALTVLSLRAKALTASAPRFHGVATAMTAC